MTLRARMVRGSSRLMLLLLLASMYVLGRSSPSSCWITPPGYPQDGEWTAPQIDNPEYKGPWVAKKIPNPDYKGPWVHPEIDNPEFKDDAKVHAVCHPCSHVGFELWQVKAGTIFDDIIVTDSLAEADAFAKETFDAKKDAEKKTYDEKEEAKRKAEEEERKKAEEARKAEEVRRPEHWPTRGRTSIDVVALPCTVSSPSCAPS